MLRGFSLFSVIVAFAGRMQERQVCPGPEVSLRCYLIYLPWTEAH